MSRGERYKDVYISENVREGSSPCRPEQPETYEFTARLYHARDAIKGAQEPSERCTIYSVSSPDRDVGLSSIKRAIDRALEEEGLQVRP